MNDSRIAPVFQILAEDIHALGAAASHGALAALLLPTKVQMANVEVMGEFAELETRQHG